LDDDAKIEIFVQKLKENLEAQKNVVDDDDSVNQNDEEDFVPENKYSAAPVNDQDEKQRRMRTADEVYNRIKWDNSFNKDEFVCGYEDRFKGVMEVPFDQFDTEVIPYHRIRLFKKRGVVVWDRKLRIDALFSYK